jgi:YD repeat-containing protein
MFQYDALGRIKQVNAPNTGPINYTYNGRGDRTKVLYPSPNSTTFNYTYLNDGRLQQVTQGTALTPLARYNYDAVGRVVQAVSNTNAALNSQLVTNYRYDGADRLRALRTSEAGTTVSGFLYDTDRLGLRTTITETLPLSPTLSTTRIKTMTFEGASLTDAATGSTTTFPVPSTLVLTTTGALKGGYSVSVPNIANSYLREDFAAANEIYVTLYLRVDALPSSNTRIVQISNGSTTISELQVLTTRKLRIRNNGANVGLDSAALEVGKLYRVGIHQKTTGTNTSILEAFLASDDGQFTNAFAGSSTLTISAMASRVNVGATTTSNVIAITVDDIAIDTASLAQPSVNSLRASAAPAVSGAAASTPTAIDPLAAQAPDSFSAGRMAAFGRLPIAFVPNAGQTDPSVRYQARGLHGNLFFGAGELTMALRPPTRDKTPPKDGSPRRQKPKNIPPAELQQRWIGAQPTAELAGTLDLPGRANFLIGNDPAKWRTNLATYAGMTMRQLYPGIDLHYTGTDGQLKTTYVVAPGADPSRIRWRYVGADSVAVDANGNLVVHLPAPASTLTDTEILSSTLTELAPIATQTINEREVAVPVRFVVGPDGSVSFALGTYDATQPLTIDPTLYYSTYLGGSGNDAANAIAVDSAGSAYVTGHTESADFPPPNPRPGGLSGPSDAFVAKLNPSGSALVYSTYLGGSIGSTGGAANESGNGIAVDSAGNAFITGDTTSSNFPVTGSARQGANAGSEDAFVTKLSADGSQLLYSTFLGGTESDDGTAIAVDSANQATVVGYTRSTDFPAPNPVLVAPVQASNAGNDDGFVARLNASGSALLYRTYLGGTGNDDGGGVALDSQGSVFLSGLSDSTNFPLSDPLQVTNQGGVGGQDAILAKIDPSINGTYGLIYSTYLGGNGDDSASAIAVDSANSVYLAGWTFSTNFPTATPIRSSGVGQEAFVTKLTNSGRVLKYNYDGLQRLIGADERPSSVYTYTYDLAGNRTSVQVNGGTPATYSYNFANQITNTGYTYDLAGNLTADGTTTYSYDALSRMTQRGTTTYTYNGDGTLVAQATSGVTTRYTQDLASPLSQILQTKVGSATPTDYVYGLNRLASLNGSTTTWYAADALGSVRRTFNGASATPLGVVNYDPWRTPESGTLTTFGRSGLFNSIRTLHIAARWFSGMGLPSLC